jgi:predicted nucleic acid-binding protein
VSYLLDTCFVSEFTRKRADEGVVAWLQLQDESELYLSTVTVGELEKGLANVRDATRRKRLRAFIEGEIIERFRPRILTPDERVWRRWGALSGTSERSGVPLPVLDSLLAAQAQVHGLTIVSRNEADFARCDVALLNPWSDVG